MTPHCNFDLHFPDNSASKESICNAGDPSSIPRSGRSSEERDRQPTSVLGFPGGSGGKESTCNARDLGSITGFGRSPGEGNEWLPTPELLVLIEMQWDLD